MGVPLLKILVAATGSVASIKVPVLLKTILAQPNFKFEIHLMVTNVAKRFIKLEDIPQQVNIYDDDIAANVWHHVGDRVLHVELANRADILVIAPLGANSLAKIALGISDNLVTITVRCWPFDKPLVFCPGMNPCMWAHPITAQHMATLKKWGFIEIPPVYKTLMCGSRGVGGMADVNTIAKVTIEKASKELNHSGR